MMLRIVLYAEGPAEDRGFESWLPESGELLPTTALGPAHVLVARAVRAVDGIAREPGFVGPITLNGSPARGSMLLAKKTLRRLLTYASPLRRPDLAIVLADEDGVDDRRRTLLEYTHHLDLQRVIAVPIREFEAWLIADQQALVAAFAGIETPRNPEGMKPREAKALLQGWIDASSPNGMTQGERAQRTRQVRIDLAQRVSLEVLDGVSAWKLFRSDLRDSLASIP